MEFEQYLDKIEKLCENINKYVLIRFILEKR